MTKRASKSGGVKLVLNEIPLKRKSLKKLLKNLSKRKQNLLRTGDVRILRLKKKGKPKIIRILSIWTLICSFGLYIADNMVWFANMGII